MPVDTVEFAIIIITYNFFKFFIQKAKRKFIAAIYGNYFLFKVPLILTQSQ